MEVEISTKLDKKLVEISRRDSKLYAKIRKQLKCFAQQPTHPSLKLHKLSNFPQDTWSIYIDRSIRMVFSYDKSLNQQVASFFDLGSHDQLYRKKK